MLENFDDNLNIAIFGTNGGIGEGLVNNLKDLPNVKNIYSFSRSNTNFAHTKIIENSINIENEDSIKSAAENIPSDAKLDIVIIATGLLHNNDSVKPEKSLKEISFDGFLKSYAVNAVGPAIIAKHFSDKMNGERKSVFSAISAKAGSISENHLGGWYNYRSAKAALNQIMKNLSVEITRRNKNLIFLTLNPGIVDTKLSEPFKSSIPKDKLFSGDYAAQHLIKLINNADKESNGKFLDWDGNEIRF